LYGRAGCLTAQNGGSRPGQNANVGNIVGEIVVSTVFGVVRGPGAWQAAMLLLAAMIAGMGYLLSAKLVYPPPSAFELPADQAGVADAGAAAVTSEDGAAEAPIGLKARPAAFQPH
jgi:hypothetical protein